MSEKTILITGSTGKQGRSVINALRDLPEGASNFHILAVTRNPDSASAQSLAKLPNVKVIQGDLENPEAIFDAAGRKVWGAFSVQQAIGGGASPASEERQGKAFADAALKHGVEHFVYTSVDRGGAKSETNPTNVPHFISKHRIEEHLKAKSAGKMDYTIIRPVAFMEGFTPDFMGKAFAATWYSGMTPDRKLQVVATKDIGFLAAQAFANPEKYKNTAVSIAGDDISFNELDAVFREVTGNPVPRTFTAVGWMLRKSMAELGTMFNFFEKEGYGANIAESRKTNPNLVDFRTWLKTSSFAQKK